MAHKFDVNNRNKLDNPKRREMLPINKVVTEIGVEETDQVADWLWDWVFFYPLCYSN